MVFGSVVVEHHIAVLDGWQKLAHKKQVKRGMCRPGVDSDSLFTDCTLDNTVLGLSEFETINGQRCLIILS